jgi:hypothetical protein
MINAVSAGMSMPPSPRREQSLSDEQQALISETLSQFDSDNLTEEDALSIVQAFSQAGIEPSKALEKSMSSAGFDAESVGKLASVSEPGNRPAPPKQSTEEITSMVDYLSELMEEKLADSNTALSDEDKQSILALIFEKFDIEEGESIINTTA